MTGNPAATDTPEAAQSPNDLLASQITEELVAARLITETHKGPLLSKLKAGGVTQEDWNLWIDMATAPRADQGDAKDE